MASDTALADVHPTQVALAAASPDASADEALLAEELLVEEISIDGMCGVY